MLQTGAQQWHEHSYTCRYGINWSTGSRSCKLSGLSNTTKPVKLIPDEIKDENDEIIDVNVAACDVIHLTERELENSSPFILNHTEISIDDLIVWELQEPTLPSNLQLTDCDQILSNHSKRKTKV